AASQPYFQAHWRKLRGPWVRLPGVAGQLVTTIALRTSVQDETQWAVSGEAGKTWTPDVRVWNMNEGSFDQREAIYAPTPSTIAFRLTVPGGARLRFAPAVATPLPATGIFSVNLVDEADAEHVITETHIPPRSHRRWLNVEADLSPFAGQRVELKLQTGTTASIRDLPADDTAKHGLLPGDVGAAESSAVPPMALALWGDP